MFASAPPEAPAESVSAAGAYVSDPAPGLADAAGLIDAVRAAFRAALQRDTIGDHDDFFDMGGDSILAVELFLQLQRDTGREYPMTAIYDAPTVSELAALLAADETPRAGRPLAVLLRAARPGCALPPLFLVHGIDGVVVTFTATADRIEDGRAVYAFAPPPAGDADLPDRVEDMADLYVRELRDLQPNGPYHLAGYSFGGLVAFEMACQLEAAGATVARLMLLDTVPHPRTWPAAARLYTLGHLLPTYLSPWTMIRAAKFYAHKTMSLPRGAAVPYVIRALTRLFTAPLDVSRAGFLKRISAATETYVAPHAFCGAPMLPAMAIVQAACTRAYHAYRPGHFAGTVDFIKARAEDFVPFSAARLWRRYAGRVRVHLLDCGHVAMIRAGAAPLAQAMSACLRAAGDAR